MRKAERQALAEKGRMEIKFGERIQPDGVTEMFSIYEFDTCEELYAFLKVARDCNSDVHFSNENLWSHTDDTEDPDAVQFAMYMAVKEIPAIMKSYAKYLEHERSEGCGHYIKARCGGYSGGRCPYGYKVSDGKLVINPDEKPIVEYVFKRHHDGIPMLIIADELDNLGYKTRKGTRFQNTSVRSIVKNELLYRGMYKYGDMDWVQGVHEPILKED